MPLSKVCSIDALERNIAAEIRAGKPREQAVAIARETLRDACREAGKPVPTRKALDVVRKQTTTEIQTLILPKDKFRTREAAEQWAEEHDFRSANVRETSDSWRLEQRPAKEFGEGTFRTIDIDEDKGVKAVIGRPMKKVAKGKRERTREFLEEAFERARRVLNPRDFAVIFQAARSSAGGKISALRRRERKTLTAAEKQLIDKAALCDMSKAELMDLARTVDMAYRAGKKGGGSVRRVLSRAGSIREEFRRRGMDTPTGPVWVELKKRGKKDVRKGFKSGDADGGSHAHSLDRRNSKTLDDGAHMHLWSLPGTNEIVYSNEDGYHEHAIADSGNATESDGAHSHRILLPTGALVETKLGGAHDHELMLETSGLDGLHTHAMVLPDGSEIESLSPAAMVELMDHAPPTGGPMEPASVVARALTDLRSEREAKDIGAPLPSLPDLDAAVEMASKGERPAPPTFTLEVVDAGDYPGLDAQPGDMVEVRHDGEVVGFAKHVLPDHAEDVEEACIHWQLIEKHTTPVPFVGPEDAKLMFVCTAPNEFELARKQGLVGEDALTFERTYLKPLGLSKRDVAIGFAMPVVPHNDLNAALCEKWAPHLVAAMKTYRKAKVVALGRVAREVLAGAGVEYWSLPHPSAVRKRGDSGEVARKLKAIAKALDGVCANMQDPDQQDGRPSDGRAPGTLADAISEMRKTGRAMCRVVKTADEKQIVYGVVLDPYKVDLQSEWVPPAEIESTAHGFMKKSRVIGFEHLERAEAQLVESWVEPYPSPADYEAALENRPHRAFKRQFGDDEIHSGSWVAGVQVGDREWELHKQGKLNSFSVGGFSFKAKVTTAAMPEVEFIELIQSPA